MFSVSPSIDPGVRAIEVTVRTTTRPERLRDGEFVACFIMVAEAPDAVVVPFEGFIREDARVYGFVVDPDSKVVERRDLVLGLRGLEEIQVTEGLTAGELLVTRGRRTLTDGARVDVAQIDERERSLSPAESTR